jgi:hypothetical protein
MTEPPLRGEVTITVDEGGGRHPNPAEFAWRLAGGIGQIGQYRQCAQTQDAPYMFWLYLCA